jgi:hypothetical protein|tara:strand:+ start:14766 stop:15302 length:537 start_codon:yes stop_codon:yes gene_type:complete
MDSKTKKIVVIEEKPKKVKIEKPKKKRVVTQTIDWEKAIEQLENIDNIEDSIETTSQDNDLCRVILKQIKSKVSGYLGQDRDKKLVDKEKFVTVRDVITLFKTSRMICFYCKEKTEIMYEYVREPKQWTLERLDNSLGHIRDNVVISCLSCNIRRRTMASERYVLTKELSKIVKLDHD